MLESLIGILRNQVGGIFKAASILGTQLLSEHRPGKGGVSRFPRLLENPFKIVMHAYNAKSGSEQISKPQLLYMGDPQKAKMTVFFWVSFLNGVFLLLHMVIKIIIGETAGIPQSCDRAPNYIQAIPPKKKRNLLVLKFCCHRIVCTNIATDLVNLQAQPYMFYQD